MKKIGVLTSGGDCSGLNAAIFGILRTAIQKNISVFGIQQNISKESPFELINLETQFNKKTLLQMGGTILGSILMTDIGFDEEELLKREKELQKITKDLDCLIVIAGDSGIMIGKKFCEKINMPMIAIPKTIDNDVKETDFSIGFKTAIENTTSDIDRLYSTALSHRRIMIAEVMGRDAGYIALYAGIASGADVILIPENPYDLNKLKEFVKEKYKQLNHLMIVVAEGTPFIQKTGTENKIGIGEHITAVMRELDLPARFVRLGHLQRGGTPCAFDRLMAVLMGEKAVELAVEKTFQKMIVFKNNKIDFTDLSNIDSLKRKLSEKDDWLFKAKNLGIFVGN